MKVGETKVVRGTGDRHVIIVAQAAANDSGSNIVSRYTSRLFEAAALPTKVVAEHKTLRGAERWAAARV